MHFSTAVIFGGSGFIGRHLACELLSRGVSEKVVLCDLLPTGPQDLPAAANEVRRRVLFRRVDVRCPIEPDITALPIDLVVNLAAVHREPGHRPEEYFATNLSGAENVCAWAERAGCRTVVFTSSISPYGPTESAKDEQSEPAPLTPYGKSKLGAERIHREWRERADTTSRRLVIVRPGVVFGPGENGNVTRMIRAVLGRYFVYMGNRRTRKAGGYVKELCGTILWALERQLSRDEPSILYNFTMAPPPTIEEFVHAICQVAAVRRRVPRLPYVAVWSAAWLAHALGGGAAFHPLRVQKLVRSNNIVPAYLARAGYAYRYTLATALADWRADRPDEWRGSRSPR